MTDVFFKFSDFLRLPYTDKNMLMKIKNYNPTILMILLVNEEHRKHENSEDSDQFSPQI